MSACCDHGSVGGDPVTEIPHATDIEPWKLAIISGAMLQAEVVPGILHTTFAERIRALSVVDADRAGARDALETLRTDLHQAVDNSFQQASELAGEWWA
jgi:hypothetical protein